MNQSGTASVRNCLRCGGELEPGMIPDRADFNLRLKSTWEGVPPPAPKWFGMELWPSRGKAREIRAYRCVNCGTLELVAAPREGE
jgi:hypothetical protein